MAQAGDHQVPAGTEIEGLSPANTGRSRGSSRFLPRIFLGLLLWFSFFRLPATAISDQPPQSWEGVLSFASSHHLQWGRDIIFTYGPLGFLTSDYYWGDHFWFILLWASGFALMLAILLIDPIECLVSPLRIILCAGLPWLTVPRNADLGVDPIYLFAITVIGMTLLSARRQNSAWLVVLTSMLSWISLIKFTFCLDCILVLLIVVLTHSWQRNWKPVGTIIGSTAVSFPLAWLLAGQNLLNLGVWFRESMQISSGYSSAMPLPPFDSELAPGILIGVCLLALLLVLWVGSGKRLTPTAGACIVFAGIFLAWKEGFLRADTHTSVFLIYAFLVATVLPAMFPRSDKRHLFSVALAVAIVILVTGTFALRGATFLVAAKAGIIPKLSDTATAVFAPMAFKRNLDAYLESMRREARQPQFAAIIGTEPVGVLNYDQDIAILNGLNYRPHPVFQSYSAYTPELQRRNAAFFDSAAAPEYVLWRPGTIDARFPTLDDGRVILKILADYSPVSRQKEFVLWKRNSGPGQSHSLVSPDKIMGSAGQWVPIPARVNWLRIELDNTWFGSIKEFLYQGSVPLIQVRLADGRIWEYRLPAGCAAAGFVINPLLFSADSLVNPFLNQSKPIHVVAFRILLDERCYDQSIRLEMQAVQGIPALRNGSEPH